MSRAARPWESVGDTDGVTDAWRSARPSVAAAIAPQPGQRGGGSPQPAGQAIPVAALGASGALPSRQQPSTRQQLLRALSGAL